MGVHYINLDLIMDPGLDPAKPEVLFYANSNDGARLVAVEYLAPIGPPGAPVPDPAPPAPRLFGQTFDGPWLAMRRAIPLITTCMSGCGKTTRMEYSLGSIPNSSAVAEGR